MSHSLESFMMQCVELGKIALERGESPVGAILVYNDEVIGQGIEAVKTNDDATHLAEVLAVQDAIKNGKKHLLHLAAMYSTHEPCLAGAYLLRHHHIPLVVYGIEVPYIGGHRAEFKILESEEVPYWGVRPKVIAGICEAACQALKTAYETQKKDK